MDVTCSQCNAAATLSQPSTLWKCAECGAVNVTDHVEDLTPDRSTEIAALEAQLAELKGEPSDG